MDEYDVVVIGGGAAGLSAALVLSRARRRVAVVDAGAPRNAPAAQLHGFLSRDGLPPHELLAAARREVEGYGGRLIGGRVTGIVPGTGREAEFQVLLADGPSLSARRVLVTTGLRDELPEIPGVRERWGRDLLHCPYCHGYEVRDQPVAVLGGTPDAVQHAHLVRQWSPDVVFLPHTDRLTADQREKLAARGIGVVEGLVSGLVVDDDRLSGVRLATGRVIRRAALFVRPRSVPNDELLVGLGCATDDHGWVVTDATGRTTVPGVWAAGNAVDPRAQVITAAGQGSAAAIAVNADLVEDDVADAVHDFKEINDMSPDPTTARPTPVPPPTKHQLALMIWLAVFPTLVVLNLALSGALAGLPVVARTFVLATIAVPIVIYGLMPKLHRIRARLITRTGRALG